MLFGVKRKFIVLPVVLAILLLAGCGPQQSKTDNTKSDTPKVSGSITAAGSSALLPLVQQAASQFTSKNPDAKISVQAGGSGTGLTMIAQGSVDIGNSDLFANEKLDEAKTKDLVDHKVCVVGFATVVNPDVTVDNLTKQQLKDIFTGKITNWKDVGGKDQKITIVNRPSSSGTRATFKKYALDGLDEAQGVAMTEDNSGSLRQTVAQTPGAISYLALSYVTGDNSVKALKLDGVEPTVDNITAGKYPIWSYEHMYTKGEPKGLTKAFIDYMMGDEAKPLIKKLGYIVGSDMKVTRDK